MKNIILMLAIMVAVIFAGCGEDFEGDENYSPPQNIDTGLSVEQSGDGVLVFEYLDNGAIKIICEGDCGDISVNPLADDFGDSISPACPDGFVWCPIEGKCIPGE